MQQKAQGLNKEFQKKDVNRLRNLIQGKTGASTGIQVGYNKKTTDYKEGDVWKENRKTWTIKNGIKQTTSKLDAIKKEVFMPLCCPKCSKVMKGQLDKPNYKLHKKCHNCVVDFEHKLKIHDKYDDYVNELKNKNNLTILDEAESYLLDAINNSSNSQYISENGVIERWVGGIDKEKASKEVKQTVKELTKKIKSRLND
tara:strand:+ start:35 stop:631 length:597 start_codon:yes stop_codon:yes gene_type:complete